ncbi:hypothetical protein D3C83_63550 [compost metagenome]
MIVVMTGKRVLKPTGWVVDMHHYLDEKTGFRSCLGVNGPKSGPKSWLLPVDGLDVNP